MTMTDERLAELDAAYAKQAGTPFGENWIHLNTAAKHHIFAAYPDLRAHIDAQAATIARLRAEVERLNGRALVLEAHLTEAIERVEKGDLDDRMCCDGHMCGCQGSTNADQFLHFARAALTGAA